MAAMAQDWGGFDSKEAQGVVVMDHSVLMVLMLHESYKTTATESA